MKILHLTNSKKGGAGIYAINNIKSMSDNYSNTLCSFRSFFCLGFFDMSVTNIYKIFTFFIFKLFNKKIVRFIPPDYSIWNKEKLTEYFKNFDEIIVYRFTNFLSFQELVLISKYVKKLTIIAVDPSISRAGCYYAYDCKVIDRECKNCKSKLYYDKLKNIVSKHDWKNTKIIFANHLEKKQFEDSYWNKSGVTSSVKILKYKPLYSINEIEEMKFDLVKKFEKKLIITISSLYPTNRKGFHLISPFLAELDKKFVKINKKIIVEIIIKNPKILEKQIENYDNINVNLIKTLDIRQFEKKLINSHLFLSFSISDSGPFILNMCHFLKTPVISFNVGVASTIALVNDSFFISKNHSYKQHIKYIIEIIKMNKKKYYQLINKSNEI